MEKNSEIISEYLDRSDDLAAKLSTNDIDVGMAVLKSMRNGNKKEKISFECNKKANYSYVMIKKLIKTAYSEVDKISPFDSSYKKFMQVSLRDSEITTTDELLRQVLINTNVAFSALLQGMRSLNSTMISEVSIAKSRTFNTAASFDDKSQESRKYKPLSEVECYVCDQMSHYASYHKKKESQHNEILTHAVISEQPMMSSNLVLIDEEVEELLRVCRDWIGFPSQ